MSNPNAKHTPVPWKYITNVGPTRALIVEPDGTTIMECHANVGSRSTFAANAALIVKAVNCHQVLVDALRELFATVTVGRERFDNPYEPNTICYSAVQQAEGGTEQ
jgi:hypothetical protein